MPANILTFNSGNSAYAGFEIHQDHDTSPVSLHDHQPEKPPESDGWVSTVVRLKTSETRGPYKFTGEAMAEMRLWAAEIKGLKPVQDSVNESTEDKGE